jgi:hypothetical protein
MNLRRRYDPNSLLIQYASAACCSETEETLVTLSKAVKRPDSASHRENLGRLLHAMLDVVARLECNVQGDAMRQTRMPSYGFPKVEFFDMNYVSNYRHCPLPLAVFLGGRSCQSKPCSSSQKELLELPSNL